MQLAMKVPECADSFFYSVLLDFNQFGFGCHMTANAKDYPIHPAGDVLSLLFGGNLNDPFAGLGSVLVLRRNNQAAIGDL